MVPADLAANWLFRGKGFLCVCVPERLHRTATMPLGHSRPLLVALGTTRPSGTENQPPFFAG